MHFNFEKSTEKGFTLIELMIVIAIIGILAAIAIPQFSAYRTRSYNAIAQSDLKNAATAEEAYYVDHEMYGRRAVQVPDYGFYRSDGVQMAWITGSGIPSDGYGIAAYHESGDRTYTLTGPGGTITSD